MKHRAGSSKIKYEHRMIGRLRKYLEEQLEPMPEIRSIIPGRISRTRGGHSELEVRFQYATETGAKLLARGPGSVQEIFVVTEHPQRLRKRIEQGQGN